MTLGIGTTFFVWGAYTFDAPTWDVPVSILMSAVTFLLAPWSIDQMLRGYASPGLHRLRIVAGIVGIYACGSGSYELYHLARSATHPVTYWENLFFSIPTAIVAGIIWRLDGTLREIVARVRSPARSDRTQRG